MLKISTIYRNRHERVLKLEGKLFAEWVGELQDACRSARAHSVRVSLDLAGLQYADRAGTIALRDLIHQGFSITTTSPFVGELLKEI